MRLENEDYQALAEFRCQIRKFLAMSDDIAQSGGLRPQQYMMLLALRGLPEGLEPTILVLAERLRIRHNSAVELANRLAGLGLILRNRSAADSRKVYIHLTVKGAALIEKLVAERFVQLHSSQPELVKALHRVLSRASHKKPSRRTSPKP